MRSPSPCTTSDLTESSQSTDPSQADLDAFRRNFRRNQDQDINSVPRRIYILGLGSIGKLIAHSLRSIPNPPPVTLFFHRKSLLSQWEQAGKKITLVTDNKPVYRGGYDVERYRAAFRKHGVQVTYNEYVSKSIDPHLATETAQRGEIPSPESEADFSPIHNLIVCNKAPDTVGALLNVAHRLLPTSNILFMQNGMGVIDEVSREVFPDPAKRPNYMQGIISHGVWSHGPFKAIHAGHGTIQIGLLPREDTPSATGATPARSNTPPPGQVFNDEQWSAGSRYLLRTLLRAPALAAVPQTPTELVQAQLEKLAVNAVMNPITALMDSRNGCLLYNYSLTRAQRMILAEVSLVVRSLPELKGLPNLATRFSPSRLETLVVSVAYRTRDNVSSMLAHVRDGQRTEVDYINGYIVKRGEEIGVKCLVNYFIMQLVAGKSRMIDREKNEDYVPSSPVLINAKSGVLAMGEGSAEVKDDNKIPDYGDLDVEDKDGTVEWNPAAADVVDALSTADSKAKEENPKGKGMEAPKSKLQDDERHLADEEWWKRQVGG